MKSNQMAIILASLILGISFIGGCLLMNNQTGSEREAEQKQPLAVSDSPLMTMEEATVFLNLSKDQIIQIIKTEHDILTKSHSFTGTMFPYINVDNKYIFKKDLLLKWMDEASINRTVYLKGQRQ